MSGDPTFDWRNADGDHLFVRTVPGEYNALMEAGEVGQSVSLIVPHGDVPEVARKLLTGLHEAAGLPVPIVLDRVSEHEFRTWIQASRNGQDGEVLLDIGAPLTFQSARWFAAALVGAVERAENEPDPAEVEELARVIRSSGRTGEDAARAILARYDITERKP